MTISRNAFLVAAMIIFWAGSFVIDLHLTRGYAGIDLRDKIVGSRSLLSGRSMYYDPWKPGEPEAFIDAKLQPGATMTRYTGSPFQALLFTPLAALSYPAARQVWLLLQYLFLFGTIWLIAHAYGAEPDRRLLIMALASGLILASGSWRLHAERGQVYVAAALLIAGIFASMATRRHVLAGVLIAALVLIKPTYGIIAAPLVLRLNLRLVLGGLGMATLVAGVFAFLPNGLNAWVEYPQAMQHWQDVMGSEPDAGETAGFTYPKVVEGIAEPTSEHPMEFQNGSVTKILQELGVDLPRWLPMLVYALFLCAVAGMLVRRTRTLSGSDLLLLGFCCWTVLMWLLPVPRFDYQVVHWAAPVLVVFLTYPQRSFAWNATAVIAAALLLGAWTILPVRILMAEALMLLLIGALIWQRMHGGTPAIADPSGKEA